jgi:hypothetical protein
LVARQQFPWPSDQLNKDGKHFGLEDMLGTAACESSISDVEVAVAAAICGLF